MDESLIRNKMHLNELLQRLYDRGVRDFSFLTIVVKGSRSSLKQAVALYDSTEYFPDGKLRFKLSANTWTIGSGTRLILGYKTRLVGDMVVTVDRSILKDP